MADPAGTAPCRVQRQFVELAGCPESSNVKSRFRLLQWNLLADGLAQHGDFVRAKPEVLEWSYRRPLILAEVQESQADVLCFQELNYYEELAAELAHSGYQGCFLAKQRSAALKYSSPADGIAIFWRADRFQSASNASGFHFLDGNGAQSPQGCLHVLLTYRAEDDSNTAAAGRQLMVATTHLKAKEGADLEQIRLQQVQQLLDQVQKATWAAAGAEASGMPAAPPPTPSGNGSRASQQASSAFALPLIVAGDFNTVLGSPACQVLACPPWSLQSIWSIPTGPGAEPAESGNGVPQAAAQGEEDACPALEFSTWKFRSTGESKRVIDHVWFTQGQGGLCSTRRWRMLNEQEIGPDGLPCEAYPSDHLALCVEFGWEL